MGAFDIPLLVVGITIIIISVFLFFERVSFLFLIAGYNTLSAKEKAKYDKVALCRFMGKILLLIGLLFICMAAGDVFNLSWLWIPSLLAMIAIATFAVIYCNTGNHFRNSDDVA